MKKSKTLCVGLILLPALARVSESFVPGSL